MLKALKEFLEEKITMLKRELDFYEYLLSIVEAGAIRGVMPSSKPSPGERVEEIKRGKTPVARLFIGHEYVRIVPLVDLKDSSRQLREYLVNALDDLKRTSVESARLDESEAIDYDIVEDPVNGIREVIVKNIKDEVTLTSVKSILRFAFERIV